MLKKLLDKIRPRRQAKERLLPLFVAVLLFVAGVSFAVYLTAALSPRFAAWFNQTVAAFFRALLAYLTGWLPFSVAEILLYSLPLWAAGAAILLWRRWSLSRRSVLRFTATVLAVCSFFFSSYVFTMGAGYHTAPLDERMGLSADAVTPQELKDTAALLAAAVNGAAEAVSYGEDGFSQMPYERSEMNERLLAAYATVCEQYGFIQSLRSRVKPVIASHAMSYTHITGIYSYFTGEANINVYFPSYSVVYTAAHELAHQRGIARENEANFVAFLVTEASDDPYIRYCGYLSLFEYVVYALYSVDREAYWTVMDSLAPEVLGELRAYDDFFEEFRDSAAADVSDAVNDAYIKVNGDEAGSASYGLVVDLAVAYLHRNK